MTPRHLLLQETWDHTQPLPDLRLLIIEPASLNNSALARLQEVQGEYSYRTSEENVLFEQKTAGKNFSQDS